MSYALKSRVIESVKSHTYIFDKAILTDLRVGLLVKLHLYSYMSVTHAEFRVSGSVEIRVFRNFILIELVAREQPHLVSYGLLVQSYVHLYSHTYCLALDV